MLNYLAVLVYTVLVYTKTIIHLSVGGLLWIFTLLLRSSVIYHDKPPPLRWIIAIYSREASDRMPQAKRVYNLVAREARVHHVNRAWS